MISNRLTIKNLRNELIDLKLRLLL